MALNTNKNGRIRSVNKLIDTTYDDSDATTIAATTFTIYTCPANCKSVMSLIMISNVSSGNADVEVEFNRSDTTTNNAHMHIVGDKTMATGDTITIASGNIVFESGDTLTATAAGANTIHVDILATVEEFFIPVGG
mgnify:CR=1 FL=1